MVSAYLEFAELQAIRRKPMYMKDGIAKLDDFIRISDSEILIRAGTVSHMEAEQKVMLEYERYKTRIADELSEVEKHFLDSINRVQKKLQKRESNSST